MEENLLESVRSMHTELQEMKENLATKDEIKVLREELASVNNKVSNMLDLLFSMREAQIDEATEVVINLKQVEKKIDKLELRIIKNNLK